MAEIDNLEIRISADSQSAAQKVNALASSLDALGKSAETARHGLFNSAEAIGTLSQVASSASQVSAKLGALQSTLSSLSALKAPDMSGFQNLTRALSTISQSIGAFANNTNIQKAVDNIRKIGAAAAAISDLSPNATKLIDFFNKINTVSVDQTMLAGLKELSYVSRRITNAQPNDNAADSLRLFIDTVRVITEDDIEKMRAISEAAQSMNKLPEMQQAEETTGEDAKISNKANAFRKLGDAIGFVTIKAAGLANALGKIGGAASSGMVKLVLFPIKKIGSALSNAAKKAGEFFSSIKRIAMYRIIRSAMKAISQGFQEGRENLYQYSVLINGQFAKSMDMAATSFLYLKNSIGAATAPLTNYLVPILDRVIDHVVELINKFNEMTAVLTGASTWTKAIKYPVKWQEAADDANSAAKKLKSTMLGFDELNVIEPNSTGRGSGNDSGLDYSRMFTEVKVDMDLSDKMKSDVPAILEPIVSAWESTGAETLDKIANSWRNIKELVGGVRDTFLEIWENGTGQRSMEILLETTGNIARAFGNVASSIKIAWDNAGAGKRILQGVWNIANNIGTVFSRTWKDIADWAATLNFSPAMDALGGLFEAIQRLTDPDGTLARMFTNMWNKVLKPLATWTIEEGVPAAIDGVTGAIGLLGTAIEKVEPYIDKFTDFLAKLGSITGDTVVALLECVSAMDAISRGEDVSDKSASAIEKGNDALLRYAALVGGNSLGAAGYFTINQWLQGVGEHWLDTEPEGDRVNYEKGQALHIAEMQKNWNSPTSIPTWGRSWGSSNSTLAGKLVDFSRIGDDLMNYALMDDSLKNETAWDDSGKGGFFRAFWAGLGVTQDDLDNFTANALKSVSGGAVPSVINEITKPKSGGSTSSNGTQNLAMASGIDWNKTLSTDEAQSAFKKIKGFFTDFSSNWTEGWKSMKKIVSEKWEGFKTDWGEGVDTIRGKWDGFKENWSIGWESLKKSASDKWNAFKDDWSVGWASIKNTASGKWESIKSDWGSGVETIKKKWDEFKSAWSDGWNQIYLYAQKMVGKVVSVALWIWQGSDGSGGIKNVVNSILSGVESFFNFFVNGINFLIGQLNNVSFNIPDWIRNALGYAGFDIPANVSLNIPTISAFSLPRLADGGIIDSGQMFIARESGAEFVGQYNNRTAVMNNDQIVEAVASGVYRAVTTAMQNGSSGSQEVKVYLDGRQITAKTEEVKRDKGVSLLGGVVFA